MVILSTSLVKCTTRLSVFSVNKTIVDVSTDRISFCQFQSIPTLMADDFCSVLVWLLHSLSVTLVHLRRSVSVSALTVESNWLSLFVLCCCNSKKNQLRFPRYYGVFGYCSWPLGVFCWTGIFYEPLIWLGIIYFENPVERVQGDR